MYTYQYNIYASMIQTLKELRQLNDWVIGFLDELSSQRPLADTLEGVQLQKLWYQVRGEGGEIVYEMCKLGRLYTKVFLEHCLYFAKNIYRRNWNYVPVQTFFRLFFDSCGYYRCLNAASHNILCLLKSASCNCEGPLSSSQPFFDSAFLPCNMQYTIGANIIFPCEVPSL